VDLAATTTRSNQELRSTYSSVNFAVIREEDFLDLEETACRDSDRRDIRRLLTKNHTLL
jgi:hypothetical protein